MLPKIIRKPLFLLIALAGFSCTQAVAQPAAPTYEDDIIRARVLGASLEYAGGPIQASLIIENKTSRDLLLAVESSKPKVISDLGGASSCSGTEGMKILYETSSTDPMKFTRLKPKQMITVNINRCNVRVSSQVKSISINMPLILLENERKSSFVLDISGIPIRS
jgi:hypothetical protein